MVSAKNITLNIKNAKYSVINVDETTGAVTYSPFVPIPNLVSTSREPEETEATKIYGDGETALAVSTGVGTGKLTSSVNNSLSGLFRKDVLGYTVNSVGQYANNSNSCKPKIMFYFEEELSQRGDCKKTESNIRRWLFANIDVTELTEEREARGKDPAENSQELEMNYSKSIDPNWNGKSFIFMDLDKTTPGFDMATYLKMGTTPEAPKFPKALVQQGGGTSNVIVALTNLAATDTKIDLYDNTTGTTIQESVTVSGGTATLNLTNLVSGHTYDIILNGDVLTSFSAS